MALPEKQYRPFAAAAAGGYDYPGDPVGGRLGLVAALFETAFGTAHEQHVALWARLRQAAAHGRDVGTIRTLLCTAPLEASLADDAAILAAFNRATGPLQTRDVPALAACAAGVARRRAEADRLLAGFGA